MLKRNESAFKVYNEINSQLNENVLQSTKENGIIKAKKTLIKLLSFTMMPMPAPE